jgi:hypothetical protein
MEETVTPFTCTVKVVVRRSSDCKDKKHGHSNPACRNKREAETFRVRTVCYVVVSGRPPENRVVEAQLICVP